MSEPSLSSLGRLFLRIGFTAFGGPAAHIAMMHDELVRRKRWMDEQAFVDRMGITSLIPGPNSTELAILAGSSLGGFRGLLVAGVAFVGPAVLIVLALAWVYVTFGETPAVAAIGYGVKPVVVALVAVAIVSLLRRVVAGPLQVVCFAGALVGYLAGVNELLLLFGFGVAVALVRNLPRARLRGVLPLDALGPLSFQAATSEIDLGTLFLVFLKTGALLYGSGYVLLAFLRADLVTRLGWLTEAQLIDAVAIGQLTPGPLFSTVTFVGYLLGGFPGAVLATVGMFLPSFLLVALVGPLASRLRHSPWTGAFLDGVNAAALALMAGVALELGRAAVVDAFTVVLALGGSAVLLHGRLNSAWVIAGGALLGLAFRQLT